MSALTIAVLWSAVIAQSGECVPTPKLDLLPGVIAPMAGDGPVWVIATGNGGWGDTLPLKTVWVLARRLSGDLRVSGHRLDGAGTMRFRVGLDGPVTDSLFVKDAVAASMIPGGASAAVMQKYAFVAAYVFFPSPGCWEVNSEWGGTKRSVTVLVKP